MFLRIHSLNFHFRRLFLFSLPYFAETKTKSDMEQLNKIELRGNIGTVRISQQGDRQVANFSVATTFVYVDRQGNAIADTQWHNVAAWSLKGMPDFKELATGRPVYVVGRLRSDRYTGSDGVERFSYSVQAAKVELLNEPLNLQTSTY